jgi:hypothetical protein
VDPDARVSKVLWGMVLLAVLLAVALSRALTSGAAGQGARAYILRAAGPVMALEPTRDAVQLDPTLPVDAVFADLPGGYPVIAATRPVPHWRAVRVAREAP